MSTTSPPPVNDANYDDEGDTVSAQLQKLEKEINAQREVINSMSLQDLMNANEDDRELKMTYQAAQLKFSEMRQQYDLILEKQRVESVVREHAEMHSPYTQDCPICLETIGLTSFNSWIVFPCCGGGMCFGCWQTKECRTLSCCPLCRGNSTSDDNARLSKIRAEKGHPQFQLAVGQNYLSGKDGHPVDVEKGLKMINLAVEQRHPQAFYLMGLTYRKGKYVPQSTTKAIHFLKEAANLGYTDALVELGGWLMDRNIDALETNTVNADVDSDMQSSVLYTTLAYSQSHQFYKCSHPGINDGVCAYAMGLAFLNRMVPNLSEEQQLYRAKHYLEEAAMKGHEGAFGHLADTLYYIANENLELTLLYGPRILFWGRKATKGNRPDPEVINLVEKIERFLRKECACCWNSPNSTDANDQFKRCARCKSTWYCSKDCQAKHWNTVHKSECMKLK